MRIVPRGSKRSISMAYGSSGGGGQPPRRPNVKLAKVVRPFLVRWIVFLIVMIDYNIPMDEVQRQLRLNFGVRLSRTRLWDYYYRFRNYVRRM